MEQQKILVVIPMNREQREKLEAGMPDAVYTYEEIQSVTKEQVREADIILGNVPASMIQQSGKLKWLHLNSAGFDPYADPGILHEDTILTTSSGAYGQAVSEHMFAMLLAMQKKLHLYRDDQRAQEWTDEGEVSSMTDFTVVIFGAGDIGGKFAKLAQAFGAYVIGVKRSPGPCPDSMDELHTMGDMEKLLPLADAVVSFLPSTEETKGIFDKQVFDRMKQGSFFVNGGRGNTVCTEELCDALESGHLAGAALDVTDPEPLPKGHRLWSLKNAWVTPHISGYYHLPQTQRNVAALAAENLRRYGAGEKLRNVVLRGNQ